MIFEVKKGRACDTALNFALEALKTKDAVIDGQGKLIELRGKQIENYAILDANWSARLTNQSEIYQADKAILKNKLRKARRIAIYEGGAVAVLLILLLL